MATLRFLGAIDTVTGSRYLLESGGTRVLVDCGLFQGPKKLRERNWSPLPGDGIAAVVLTHAHIDHSGYLPRLCKQGFTGPVYCTRGTADLLRLLLPDSGYLQEEEARHANRRGYSRHHPALPLYTREDAERCLDQVVPVEFHRRFEPAPAIAASYTRAGHILGAASVTLEVDGRRIAFSGDVGRAHDPIMRAPEPLPQADYVVVESTYGDRRHARLDVGEALGNVITETIARGGSVVVPAFAVGRAQHLLHLIAKLRAEHRIPDAPVYLDSPLAIGATELFLEHADEHALTAAECDALGAVARFAHTPDESMLIDRSRAPSIIISASGMATGGRVLHHLARFLPDEKSTVLLVGYQAAGTRGRTLADGGDELKIHGGYVPVRAHVVQLDGLSAHADHVELLDWLAASQLAPRQVFVTHGEPAASDAMRRRIVERFGWRALVPQDGARYPLD